MDATSDCNTSDKESSTSTQSQNLEMQVSTPLMPQNDNEKSATINGLLTPPSSAKKTSSLSPDQRARIDEVKQRAFLYIQMSSDTAIRETREEVGAMYSRLAQDRLEREQNLPKIFTGSVNGAFEDGGIIYDPELYLPARRDIVHQSQPTTPTRQSSNTFASAASLWDRPIHTIGLLTPPYTPQPTTNNITSSPIPAKSPRSPFSRLRQPQLPNLLSLTAALISVPVTEPTTRSKHGPCAQCTALAMPCNARWPSCQRCTLRLTLASANASRTGRDEAFYALSSSSADCCIPQRALPVSASPSPLAGFRAGVGDAALGQLLVSLHGVSAEGSVLVPVHLPLASCAVHAHHVSDEMGMTTDEAERRHWEGQVERYMELVRVELHKRERANWVAPLQERDCIQRLFM